MQKDSITFAIASRMHKKKQSIAWRQIYSSLKRVSVRRRARHGGKTWRTKWFCHAILWVSMIGAAHPHKLATPQRTLQRLLQDSELAPYRNHLHSLRHMGVDLFEWWMLVRHLHVCIYTRSVFSVPGPNGLWDQSIIQANDKSITQSMDSKVYHVERINEEEPAPSVTPYVPP